MDSQKSSVEHKQVITLCSLERLLKNIKGLFEELKTFMTVALADILYIEA